MGNSNKPGSLKENFGYRILKISSESPASRTSKHLLLFLHKFSFLLSYYFLGFKMHLNS
jgi:hypothetical protein